MTLNFCLRFGCDYRGGRGCLRLLLCVVGAVVWVGGVVALVACVGRFRW